MTNYVDVFNNDLVPPSGYAYQALTFSGTTNPTFWPYNYAGTGIVISKIIDASMATGSTIQLPDATQVSPGEDLLIFNTSAFTLTVQSYTGSAVTTIAAGTGKYLYVKTNTTTAGTWGVITYGTGTSSADAAALAGYGLSALGGATLNTAFTSTDKTALFTLDNTYRAKLVNATSGTWTLTLQAAATASSTFFFLIRNSGTGVITIDPNGAETIDGQATKDLRSGESAIIICNGTGWYSVGYGRAVQGYTLLTQSVSAGGTIALTAAQALNQLINFTGSPAAAVTVTVPNTVGVWYLTNSSSQTVTFQGVTGTAVTILAGNSMVAKSDGTNMVDALLQAATTMPSENYLVNNNFDVWQRGTSFALAATTFYYTADRWMVWSPYSNRTVSRQANSGGGASQYCFRLQRNAGDTQGQGTSATLFYTMETADAAKLAGKQITVSCFFRVGSALDAVYPTCVIYTGTGTDQSATTYLVWTGSSMQQSNPGFTYDTTWRRAYWTFTLPTSTTQLQLQLNLWVAQQATAGASAYVELYGMQVEVGSGASSQVKSLPIEEQIALCQRFYEKSFAIGTTPAQNVGITTGPTRFIQVVGAAAAQGALTINYKTRKRSGATPTITLYNPAAANGQIRNVTGSTDWTGSTAANAQIRNVTGSTDWTGSTAAPATEVGFEINGTSAAASTAGSSAAIHWTADYEL